MHDEHYASAYDMANMFRLALQNDDLKKLLQLRSYTPKERNVTVEK